MAQRPVVWALLFGGLACIGAGFFLWRSDSEPEVEIVQTANEELSADIAADIEGAVVNPGVYKFKPGARIADVIKVAGGFTTDADVMWVDSRINRAEKIEDGFKLYVPKKNETNITVAGINSTDVISINFADSGQLESLPGIGSVTAGKIIQGRPYSKLSDLIEKKVVTQKVYEQIKTMIGL